MRRCLAFCFALFAAIPAFSQFDAGQISGFIRDSSGVTVSNANVSATNEGSGEIHKLTANGEGYNILPRLFVGKYPFAKPAAGTYGVQPRNGLRGPGFRAWDMGLRKNFRIVEQQSLQFRFEMFDILNHPNWRNPIVDPTSGSFGRVTGKTNDSRQLQLALKYIF